MESTDSEQGDAAIAHMDPHWDSTPKIIVPLHGREIKRELPPVKNSFERVQSKLMESTASARNAHWAAHKQKAEEMVNPDPYRLNAPPPSPIDPHSSLLLSTSGLLKARKDKMEAHPEDIFVTSKHTFFRRNSDANYRPDPARDFANPPPIDPTSHLLVKTASRRLSARPKGQHIPEDIIVTSVNTYYRRRSIAS